MEVDDVFANEVVELGVSAFLPVIVKVIVGARAQVFETGHVADWRIEPHVEHFSFFAIDRIRNAPGEVACHSARCESAIDPAHALPDHLLAPFFGIVVFFAFERTFCDPVFEPVFVALHWEVPVFGFFQNRSFPG